MIAEGNGPRRALDLLAQAQVLPPEERAAFLEQAASGDEATRQELDSLLAHHEQAAGFLSRPALPPGLEGWYEGRHPAGEGEEEPAELACDAACGSSTPHPERVGSYRLIEAIGEGGMGVVYLAEQTEPIRRRLALKLIKPGMASREVVARFESERQALALLDHPGIARVYDAGSTADGRPYFAMEHVMGLPITEHCDSQEVSVDERLRLVIAVCDAVEHAHRNGIIHRDLKPSNILVAAGRSTIPREPSTILPGDGGAVPKVIDFGIAKAIRQSLSGGGFKTRAGVLVGTPSYMSPEQMEGQELDARSDVYSLGVVLYEILVGVLPFDVEGGTRQDGLGSGELHRRIRGAETPRPSNRLATLPGDTSRTVARNRRTDLRSLHRRLEQDLDWITLKAMDGERDRRYASASALAADISRHLAGEAVLASPPSWTYRLRKAVRRHAGGVRAALIAAGGLALGLALASFGLSKGGREQGPSADGDEQAIVWALQQIAGGGVLRINCGGGDHVSPSGKRWGRDRFFSTSRAVAASGEVEGSDDDALYRAQRCFPGGGKYCVPLPEGTYEVTLHFAELECRNLGARVFSVRLEGVPVLAGYAPAIAAAEKKSFIQGVTDGFLEIELVPESGEPRIAAIEVERQASLPPGSAVGVVAREWAQLFDGPGNGTDVGVAVAVDGAGNVLVAGRSEGAGTHNDCFVHKHSAGGKRLWEARYHGGIKNDEARAMAVGGEESVYVTGWSEQRGSGDYMTIKYRADGEREWLSFYDGPGEAHDIAQAIAVDASGSAHVTGKSPGAGCGEDFATVKYSSSGKELWAARYNGPGNGPDGSIYIADTSNHAIRVMTPAGVVTTLAGNPGVPGSANGTGAAAHFHEPVGIAVVADGSVYVGDAQNHTVRRVTPAGVVTTAAGTAGMPGRMDGAGAAAAFDTPAGLALHESCRELFIADFKNHTVRKLNLATGTVTTLAGTAGMGGSLDSTGAAARFTTSYGVAVDERGVVFVGSFIDHTVRRISPGGSVTTIGGTSTVSGSADGTGAVARFNRPIGIAVRPDGRLVLVDQMNDRLTQGTPVMAPGR